MKRWWLEAMSFSMALKNDREFEMGGECDWRGMKMSELDFERRFTALGNLGINFVYRLDSKIGQTRLSQIGSEYGQVRSGCDSTRITYYIHDIVSNKCLPLCYSTKYKLWQQLEISYFNTYDGSKLPWSRVIHAKNNNAFH